MEWTLKENQSNNSKPTDSHSRDVYDRSWSYSERAVPLPAATTGIEEQFIDYRNHDLSHALAETAVWGTGDNLFIKVYDKFSRQINCSNFDDNPAIQGHIQTNIRQYFRQHPEACYENVWFSTKSQTFVSNAQTYCSGLDPLEHSFCTTRNRFINQAWTPISSEMGRMIEDMTVCYNALGHRPNARGVTSEDINSGRCYGDMVFPDLRIGVCPAMNGLLNQESVLIIGGGPSTNNIDFSDFRDMPVWTMNNYYKNSLFDQFNNIQVATFLDEVDVFSNDALWKRVNDQNTIIFQEITDYGPEKINYIKEKANYSTYFHTRYRSKLGVGPRLMVAAILLGIKNIYFCGFDGYNTNSSDNHSFETGKGLPNWLKKAGPSCQDRQFMMLWDYVLNDLKLGRAFRTIDLSAGQPSLQYKFLEDRIR